MNHVVFYSEQHFMLALAEQQHQMAEPWAYVDWVGATDPDGFRTTFFLQAGVRMGVSLWILTRVLGHCLTVERDRWVENEDRARHAASDLIGRVRNLGVPVIRAIACREDVTYVRTH
jgi:hypothetical protein